MTFSRKGQYAPGAPQQNPYQAPDAPRYPQQPVGPQAGAFGTTPKQPTLTLSPKTLIIIGAVAALLIIVFIIILARPRCPESCQQKACEKLITCSSETDYQCKYEDKPNCDKEYELNKMGCTGKTGVMIKTFDNVTEDCAWDVDPKEATKVFSTTLRQSGAGVRFRAQIEYDQPFNLGNDELVTDIAGEDIPEKVTNLRITRVEFEGTDDKKQLQIVGEQFMNKPIPSSQVPARVRMRLDMPGTELAGKLAGLKLVFDYGYDEASGTGVRSREGKITLALSGATFEWRRPTVHYSCPSDPRQCDDGDPSTRDFCDASSAPFCQHEAIAGACGNGVCEASENKCTCAQDCGACGGAGKVTSSQCIANQCQVQLRGDIVVQPLKLVDQRALDRATVSTEIEYNSPFRSGEDLVTLTVRLDETDPTIESIFIDTLQILRSGSQEIASVSVRQPLTQVGDTARASLTIPIQGVEEEITPQAKITYTIVVAGKQDTRSYTQSMQRVVVYNPQ